MAARKLKYKSMASLEQAQEMEEDFMEGTARYSEYAVLQQISSKYRPKISQTGLSLFFAFKDLKRFLRPEAA